MALGIGEPPKGGHGAPGSQAAPERPGTVANQEAIPMLMKRIRKASLLTRSSPSS